MNRSKRWFIISLVFVFLALAGLDSKKFTLNESRAHFSALALIGRCISERTGKTGDEPPVKYTDRECFEFYAKKEELASGTEKAKEMCEVYKFELNQACPTSFSDGDKAVGYCHWRDEEGGTFTYKTYTYTSKYPLSKESIETDIGFCDDVVEESMSYGFISLS